MSMLDSGATVLFVSHSIHQVLNICNKALILKEGEMVAFGDVKEVAAEYEKMIE